MESREEERKRERGNKEISYHLCANRLPRHRPMKKITSPNSPRKHSHRTPFRTTNLNDQNRRGSRLKRYHPAIPTARA